MSEKARIRYFSIKFVIFTFLGIMILVFRESHVGNLRYFIGGLMLIYGVEGIFYESLEHHLNFLMKNRTYLGIVEIIFGVTLLASKISFESVCIIWATWSIIRESYELKEIVCDFKCYTPRILSLLESIAAIVFSIMLILEPGHHHALLHIILLNIELICSPLVVLLDEIIIAIKKKRKKAKEIEKEEK